MDDYFATTVEGTVHFTSSTELSIGIAYSHNSDDEFDERSSKNTIKLSAKHFFVETIGVDVGYSYGDHISYYDDQEAGEFSLNLYVNI